MTTEYEWVVEEIDQYGDVIASDHYDTAASAIAALKNDRWNSLALSRATFDSRDDGMSDRQYAYLVNGALPDAFDGGAKVPKRFHAELRIALDRTMRSIRA